MEEEEGKGIGEERRRMQVEEAEGKSINFALAKQNTPLSPGVRPGLRPQAGTIA